MAALIPVNALGVNAWPFSVFTSAKNFRRISLKSVALIVLRSPVHCNFSFLAPFLELFLLPTQLLSWCFSLGVFRVFFAPEWFSHVNKRSLIG